MQCVYEQLWIVSVLCICGHTQTMNRFKSIFLLRTNKFSSLCLWIIVDECLPRELIIYLLNTHFKAESFWEVKNRYFQNIDKKQLHAQFASFQISYTKEDVVKAVFCKGHETVVTVWMWQNEISFRPEKWDWQSNTSTDSWRRSRDKVTPALFWRRSRDKVTFELILGRGVETM